MPHEFYCLTFYEYTCVLAGFISRNDEEWKRTRFIAYTVYCMSSSKDGRMSIDEFYPLMGDKVKEQSKPYTKDELAAKFTEAQQRIKDLNPQIA